MIETKAILQFAKLLEGQRLVTKSHRKTFYVNVLDNALEFIPSSSGKSRKESNKNLIKVIDHFNKTRSLQSKDYHDTTYNSVYVITIIEGI